MQLRRVLIEGYKALDPADLTIAGKLLFLIGSNGAGKSSYLQSLSFINFFASGKPLDFFAERQWETADVKSRTIEKPHNTLRYHLLYKSDSRLVLWQFIWGLNTGTLVSEKLWTLETGGALTEIFSYDRRQGLRAISGLDIRGIISQGSIMSMMEPSAISPNPELILELLDWAHGITSLELLSPMAMRSNTRGSPKGIGIRGQRLAGFLAASDAQTKSRIVERLRDFYPLEKLNTTRKRAGWVDLRVSEAFGLGAIPSTHISDGFLRLLALCAIPEFGNRSSMVLLDEIEDGIEPHILPRLIERIVKDSSAQFMMTSHSPLLINFFQPEEVVLVTRAPEGRSTFTPISNLQVIQEGLEYLGPGEIWANAGLTTLNDQALPAPSTRRDINRYTREWAIDFIGGQ